MLWTTSSNDPLLWRTQHVTDAFEDPLSVPSVDSFFLKKNSKSFERISKNLNFWRKTKQLSLKISVLGIYIIDFYWRIRGPSLCSICWFIFPKKNFKKFWKNFKKFEFLKKNETVENLEISVLGIYIIDFFCCEPMKKNWNACVLFSIHTLLT